MNWLVATAASLVLLPWYTTEGTWWGASALLHGFQGRPWLLALFLPLIAVNCVILAGSLFMQERFRNPQSPFEGSIADWM